MATKKKGNSSPANKIVLKPGFRVGYPAAEDDEEFLRECFVDNQALDALIDCSSPGSVVLGRTGAGKSALLLHIPTIKDHTITIEPSDLALNYISNSTVIKFFEGLGVKFDLFFRMLWRHVLCVEILNYHYNVRKKGDFEKAMEGLQDFIRANPSKKVALEYLGRWGSKFWEQSQERIKELVERFEDELKAGVDLTGAGVPLNFSAGTKIESSKKTEITDQAARVVNAIQIKQLSVVMDILADDILTDAQKPYYIVIDRLDEDWVDDAIRFKLIRALMETVRDFRKVRNVKIVISMRTDLLERVLTVPLRWTSESMYELIDRRINAVFKRQYTSDGVHFGDIFDPNYRQAGPTFEYLWARTQRRPRDMIAFMNQIFDEVVGKVRIGANDIGKAEIEYSKKRMGALCTEWATEHPHLEPCLETLRRLPSRLSPELLDEDTLQALILHLSDADDAPDGLPQLAKGYLEDTSRFQGFRAQLITVLYKVGAIGVRLHRGDPVHFVYETNSVVRPGDITSETRISISPMLWMALGTYRHRVKGELVED
jgi:hypothetical protein